MLTVEGVEGLIARIEGGRSRITRELAQIVRDGAKAVGDSARARCPADTGELLSSIQVREDGVSATAAHASAVELGTYQQPARPFLRPALEDNAQAIRDVAAEAVNQAFS